jgi:Carboxypeptidase regulatory-like domain/TonB dependent receptor
MTRAMTRRIGLLGTLILLLSMPAAAQDFRGAITGTVTDSTGAVLPGVTITVTNVGTNVETTTVTDSGGQYQVRYLISGTYSVEGKLEGLKTVIRRGITVRVGDSLKLDLTMEAGAVSETVVVTASAPLLDTTSAVTGQVIDSVQIQRLPLGDGTAYMLSRLAPGVADSSDLHFSRPMDNGNLAGIVANGAMGGNEYTLDGAPNRVSPNNTTNQNNSGVVGFSPPSDSISEFKVQTNAFDAQVGHTAGAVVNLALKSGTNDLKGSASYFNRSDARTATPLLTERQGGEKPTREYDRMTGTLSGTIIRDRTFFMVSFERLKDIQPEPATYSVPTMKMRQGDFSEFSVPVYDPATATGTNATRTAFAGNIIPQNRINPVAREYLKYYPEPNRAGTQANYFTNQLRPYDYNAYLLRLDHNFNGSNRVFVNGYYNKRQEDRYNWALGAANSTGAGEINGFEPTHGFDYRSNKGATLGYTSILTNELALDAIGAWSEFGEWRTPAKTFDASTLGFTGNSATLLKDYGYLPFITFGGFSTTNSNSRWASLGSQRSDWGTGFNRPFSNISITPTLSALWRGHSLRGGYELRNQRWEINNAPYVRFHFNGAYTRANNSATLNDAGQSWAQFLLGLPTVGTNNVATPGSTASQFEIAANGDYSQRSHALFVQDDWRLTDRLTLNGGVRFEMHQAMTEADDRNLAGFDRSMASPIEAAAKAKYAASPIPQIAASDFLVKGGVQFADGAIYENLYKTMPRLAFSYLINDKTVLRGGAGLFSYDYYFDAGNQIGFSQPTPILTTENNGSTFLTDLTNPLPSGQLIQPPGSSLGAAAGLGLTLGTIVPSEREVPYYTRFQIGAQRDLGAGWVVEVNYLNSRGRNLPVTRDLNSLPMEYLSTSRMRDNAHETLMSQSVANPFQGLLPGSTINGATVARHQLLRPFPQYLAGSVNGQVSGTGTISVGTEEYVGSDEYNAGSIRIEKRFRQGSSLLATYTRSRTTDKLNLLNPSSGELEDRISPNDRPHRATLGGILDLPFGRGHRIGGNWNGLLEGIFGGWSLSATYQYQTGFPLTWNTSLYYNGDPKDLRAHIGGKCPDGGKAGLDCAAWDISGFYVPEGVPGAPANCPFPCRTDQRIQMGHNVRYFPSTLPHVRTDDLHLLDVGLYKTFRVPGGVALQIRIESINALNYTVLWAPDQNPRNPTFGMVTTDRNNPRDIQLGAKLTF